MMKVGFVGCGEMGEPMAGHVLKTGKFEVWIYDIRAAATKNIARKGAKIATSLEQLGRTCDLFIVMVGYDHQVKQVVTDLVSIFNQANTTLQKQAAQEARSIDGELAEGDPGGVEQIIDEPRLEQHVSPNDLEESLLGRVACVSLP